MFQLDPFPTLHRPLRLQRQAGWHGCLYTPVERAGEYPLGYGVRRQRFGGREESRKLGGLGETVCCELRYQRSPVAEHVYAR